MVLALPAVVSGCRVDDVELQRGDRRALQPGDQDRRSVEIVRVGQHHGLGQQPGRCRWRPAPTRSSVASRAHGGFAGGKQETLQLKVDPCKRYYINAQYPNPVSPDYQVVVDHVETIAGCRRRPERRPVPPEPLLVVDRLRVEFPTRRGTLTAVHDVGFDDRPRRGAGRRRRVRARASRSPAPPSSG
jgi:hypothetical protein